MSSWDLSKIDVGDMLERLELDNVTQATENEMCFSCPFHGDMKPSAYMNVNTTAFFCHGCHERGDAVKLTAHVFGLTRLKASRALREIYDVGSRDPDEYNPVRELRRLKDRLSARHDDPPAIDMEIDERFLDDFAIDWKRVVLSAPNIPYQYRYILSRGFSSRVLDEWEFGYDELSDRIVMPVRDALGRLVGFKGRAWRSDNHPKYLVLGDAPGRPERYGFPRYHVSRVVFGMHRLQNTNTHPLVICEGELDTIAVQTRSSYPAVGVNGSNFSKSQALIVRNYGREVLVCFDSDEAGTEAAFNVKEMLQPYLPVRIVPEHEGDPASMKPWDLQTFLDSVVTSRAVR